MKVRVASAKATEYHLVRGDAPHAPGGEPYSLCGVAVPRLEAQGNRVLCEACRREEGRRGYPPLETLE